MNILKAITGRYVSPTFGFTCRYDASDFIGNGLSGAVYRANLTNYPYYIFAGEKTVAIKVFYLSKGTFADKMIQLTEKLKLLKQLNHENLLAYFDIKSMQSVEGGRIELMMEYCAGGDLATRIRKLRKNSVILSLTTVLSYVAEITSGLNFLHDKNLKHGRIIPAVILIAKVNATEERLLIGGLENVAQMCVGEEQKDVLVDKMYHQYSAPEFLKHVVLQKEGSLGSGIKSDIWALGCIFVELANCFTGKHDRALSKDGDVVPTDYNFSTRQYAMMILKGYAPHISDRIPDDVQQCIGECLRRKAKQRISACELLSRVTQMIANLEIPNETTILNEPTGCAFNYTIDVTNGWIAQGAFGAVYQVKLTGGKKFTDFKAAVKLVNFNEEDISTPQRFTKLRRKYETLVKLKHSNLVNYHQIKIIKGERLTVHLLMDHHGDGSLRSLLKKLLENQVPLNPREAVRYSLEMTEGVDFLHGHRVVHADLKPSNILIKTINGENTLIICDLDDFILMDFGTTNARGTPIYMSPEMIAKTVGRSATIPGEKTDIWSLGCVMLDIGLCAAKERRRKVWHRHEKTEHEVSEQTNSAQYFLWINENGYTPFIPDTVEKNFASCIGKCFLADPEERISAASLKHLLSVQYELTNDE
ncbi:uncharacterized protein LOC129600017 isoform X2 [Paramacrobiotus metropolitanus]|nr:uncharacterized protein LOC129600017 isoform X2 [Paramacrobiotus metropolitanus]